LINEFSLAFAQTAALPRQLSEGRKPAGHVFVAQLTNSGAKQPLGEDGMSAILRRLFERVGIEGITGYDLRRTFATEFLVMRLIRDVVTGVSNRYINCTMARLVEGLEKMFSLQITVAELSCIMTFRDKGCLTIYS
jgi:integrase